MTSWTKIQSIMKQRTSHTFPITTMFGKTSPSIPMFLICGINTYLINQHSRQQRCRCVIDVDPSVLPTGFVPSLIKNPSVNPFYASDCCVIIWVDKDEFTHFYQKTFDISQEYELPKWGFVKLSLCGWCAHVDPAAVNFVFEFGWYSRISDAEPSSNY